MRGWWQARRKAWEALAAPAFNPWDAGFLYLLIQKYRNILGTGITVTPDECQPLKETFGTGVCLHAQVLLWIASVPIRLNESGARWELEGWWSQGSKLSASGEATLSVLTSLRGFHCCAAANGSQICRGMLQRFHSQCVFLERTVFA